MSKRVFIDCIKKSRGVISAYLIMVAVIFAIAFLYRLPLEPIVYAAVILAFVGILAFVIYCMTENQKAIKRKYILKGVETQWVNLSEAKTLEEEDYQEMVRTLGHKIDELTTDFETEKHDMVDYYTTWVHQIKTPIAVIRMRLEENDTVENQAIAAEIFRIEQYVEMVLQYIRLNSESNDLVIKEYKVDELVRESVRKYASQFIYRKLSLDYNETNLTIVTDKKWFSCMIEQILSNAIKYTPQGKITIYSENETLVIKDTGIGIAKEDLPRIFEKGYTGGNGRLDKKSSGLGLYLCKKAADKLGITISVESKPGEGSSFIFDLKQRKL